MSILKKTSTKIVPQDNDASDDKSNVVIPKQVNIISDDESSGDESENELAEHQDEDLEVILSPSTTVNKKVIRAMKKLSGTS
mmetsp:Transcript_11032/g.16149  ORF Transcript_11032/g.16149 Transcript_11032/m.16149 type:complete len:82 (+) Transcript_11032:7803-8048(+)